ncbi:WD repeat-containing protein 27 [Spea bombifrons]|uniref:WD repeat-containing protein 27 n=1 Tax=Spea bombifrons TaxID=233779 RepID=UPI00234B945B|nr:WD repeat-containing protein 27 [Spea bombifrons]
MRMNSLNLQNTSPQSVVSEKQFTVSTTSVSHVQLACSQQYCAFPLNGNDLCIWNTKNSDEHAIVLKGHHQLITAVTLRYGTDSCLVCSASRDYVILWNIDECKKSIQRGGVPRGLVIGTVLGEVSYLGFQHDRMMVAACAGNKIFILNAEHEEILAELTGHLGSVTAAEFLEDNLIVSISEDRTFKVWDYHKESLMYQSSVLSAFPLLSLYIDVENKQMITGCADGQLRVFSLLKEHQFRCVCQTDLQKEKIRFSRKIGDAHRYEKLDELKYESSKTSVSERKADDTMDSSLPVLSMQKWEPSPEENENSLSGISRRLWIGSSTGLLLINIANLEIEAVLNFKDYEGLNIQLAGSCSLSSSMGYKTFCLLSSMFGNQISLLEIDNHGLRKSQQCELSFSRSHHNLSIVSSGPLLTSSPLCAKDCKKPASQKNDNSIIICKPGSKNMVKDQPLVFHNKVKSSGYSTAPRMKMFSPKTNIKKTSEPSKVKKNSLSNLGKDYPLNALAPSILHKQISLVNKPTAVCCIQYSGDGQKLACGLADKSLMVFSSSLNGDPVVFTGHDRAVNGLSWSHDRNLLVSSSEDRTVRIWNARNADPALVLGKEIFSKPVRFPQFYYMDKFILLSSGAEFQLLKYSLDDCKDEIKRYMKKNVCETIQKFQMATAMEITGLSSVNDFYSYIVLSAGSDRTLEIFDLNVGSSVAVIPDVHSRAVHQICQNKGSAFSTQQPEAYNLFVTTAVGDGLKLWDIRNLRCVRRFEGHINRCQPCGVAISPCGRFIASGSEDRCAYIYEMRSSTYLQKLQGHRDSVINVAFNPSSAQLTTATLDGKLQIFAC